MAGRSVSEGAALIGAACRLYGCSLTFPIAGRGVVRRCRRSSWYGPRRLVSVSGSGLRIYRTSGGPADAVYRLSAGLSTPARGLRYICWARRLSILLRQRDGYC